MTPTSGDYGVQYLEVTAQAATAPTWDTGSQVDPAYRAYVPVYVDPPAPQIDSITVGGQPVSGSTTANNTSAASELTFNISGAVSGATVSVYMDYAAGNTTPLVTGTASGATLALSTDGTTGIAAGSHEFTVEQSIAGSAATLLAEWSSGSSSSPGAQYSIPAASADSPASAATALTIAPLGPAAI